MGTLFTCRRLGIDLMLNNAFSDALIEQLTVGLSDLARSPWEHRLALWMSTHDSSLRGSGFQGFDLDEIPWDPAELEGQRRFLLDAIELVRRGHRAALFGDDPQLQASLSSFAELVRRYDPPAQPGIPDERWNLEAVGRCPRHRIPLHTESHCLLCGGVPDRAEAQLKPTEGA
jgi:hypothetical protein